MSDTSVENLLRQGTDGSPVGAPAYPHGMESLTPLSDDEQHLLRQTLGIQCRKARESLGLSRASLAQTMGRSPSWVREIERGDQYAPPYLLLALARATARSPAWFYGQDDHARLEAMAERLAARLQILNQANAH